MLEIDKQNKETEMNQRLKYKAEFNSITNSFKVENQNQGHNSKKEALGPNTKR